MPNDQLTREIFGNIPAAAQGLFYVLSFASLSLFCWGVYRRVRLWRLGRGSDVRFDWQRAVVRFFTDVLTQRSFGSQQRRGASRAHRLLFIGFGGLFVGTLLIGVEHYGAALLGRSASEPLFHKGLYFAVYESTLDTFGIALLLGCGAFAIRRWRGRSSIAHNRLDYVVLLAIVLIGISGYGVEGLRIIREQTPLPGFSYVGLAVARLLERIGITATNVDAAHFALWWLHAIGALALIAAFPYTRLRHSLAGTLRLISREKTLGIMPPISIEDVEQTGIIGVGTIQDFSRMQLVELDACVACGRCQDVCPAHEAGKPLSPRDLVQDLYHHLSDVGPSLTTAGSAASSLCGEIITEETLWSCTTCHACVEVCPLGVSPLGMITDMRRHLVGEGHLRGSSATALQKTQRSGNPWGLPAEDRMAWAKGLGVRLASEAGVFEVLYWVGCAAAYDRRIQNVARSVAKLLIAAGVDFAVLGPEERCTGESARRIGDEFLFQELSAGNHETFRRYGIKKIVTHCPHCLNSLKHDYPQFGDRFEVVHHTQMISELIGQGRLRFPDSLQPAGGKITWHDPCYLARVNDGVAAPRQILAAAVEQGGAGELIEMPRHGRNTACCGAGGGRMWLDDTPEQRVGGGRIQEAINTGAETLAVGCPFCLRMMSDGIAGGESGVHVKDIAEIMAEMLAGLPTEVSEGTHTKP